VSISTEYLHTSIFHKRTHWSASKEERQSSSMEQLWGVTCLWFRPVARQKEMDLRVLSLTQTTCGKWIWARGLITSKIVELNAWKRKKSRTTLRMLDQVPSSKRTSLGKETKQMPKIKMKSVRSDFSNSDIFNWWCFIKLKEKDLGVEHYNQIGYNSSITCLRIWRAKPTSFRVIFPAGRVGSHNADNKQEKKSVVVWEIFLL